ncbi:hypothetical protein NW754_005280 [Fusarium falciforme]|nr:hypothetical protein NW754_005280 [Fusarium falciforme]KAJ4207408.1 hypothetical protein NW767_002660 [Fusarium falciforme]KAJ4244973.1 hypothetical protein NW757_010356 [Fusarium falciforme]
MPPQPAFLVCGLFGAGMKIKARRHATRRGGCIDDHSLIIFELGESVQNGALDFRALSARQPTISRRQRQGTLEITLALEIALDGKLGPRSSLGKESVSCAPEADERKGHFLILSGGSVLQG